MKRHCFVNGRDLRTLERRQHDSTPTSICRNSIQSQLETMFDRSIGPLRASNTRLIGTERTKQFFLPNAMRTNLRRRERNGGGQKLILFESLARRRPPGHKSVQISNMLFRSSSSFNDHRPSGRPCLHLIYYFLTAKSDTGLIGRAHAYAYMPYRSNDAGRTTFSVVVVLIHCLCSAQSKSRVDSEQQQQQQQHSFICD